MLSGCLPTVKALFITLTNVRGIFRVSNFQVSPHCEALLVNDTVPKVRSLETDEGICHLAGSGTRQLGISTWQIFYVIFTQTNLRRSQFILLPFLKYNH